MLESIVSLAKFYMCSLTALCKEINQPISVVLQPYINHLLLCIFPCVLKRIMYCI